MNGTDAPRRRALDRLDVLAGDWVEQVHLPGMPAGRTSFGWVLDRQFLLQRSTFTDADTLTAGWQRSDDGQH